MVTAPVGYGTSRVIEESNVMLCLNGPPSVSPQTTNNITPKTDGILSFRSTYNVTLDTRHISNYFVTSSGSTTQWRIQGETLPPPYRLDTIYNQMKSMHKNAFFKTKLFQTQFFIFRPLLHNSGSATDTTCRQVTNPYNISSYYTVCRLLVLSK